MNTNARAAQSARQEDFAREPTAVADGPPRNAIAPAVMFQVLEMRADGFFFRRMVPQIVPYARTRKAWDTRYAGQRATISSHTGGYKTISFCQISFLVHRLVWLFTYGEWPAGHIDHLNGDRADNRVENLRVVSDTENMRNQKLRVDNSSGFVGVSFSKQRGKWRACVIGQHVGYFETFEEAARARIAAQVGLGFTERHGKPSQGGFPYPHRTVAEVWADELRTRMMRGSGGR